MDTDLFITGAYGLTGLLLGLLCFSTWVRARRTREALDDRDRA